MTDTVQSVRQQDGTVRMIQEAKDSSGEWKPIEFWQNTSCGNSYYRLKIDSKKYIAVAGYR